MLFRLFVDRKRITILGENRVGLISARLLASTVLLVLTASIAAPARGAHRKAKLRAEHIREAEQRLSDLGYWTGPIDGVLDAASRHALIAFQKVEGRIRTGRLTLSEIKALRSARPPVPLEGSTYHIEVDLVRQVLFVVDERGIVSKILPVSTGNGKPFTTAEWEAVAVTPPGRFKVSYKIPGWRKSELGLMYYPNYIVGGIAIHGSPSVPAYPASHGCIRIPLHAAREFSEIAPIGTTVIVHERSAP